jgi:hypothetical protein
METSIAEYIAKSLPPKVVDLYQIQKLSSNRMAILIKLEKV